MSNPVRVTVTGAAGQIGYALVFRIASGSCSAPTRRSTCGCWRSRRRMAALEGVAMELTDCAFPLLRGLDLHDNADDAFDGVNIALLVGSRPRTKGMERAELLGENGKIFTSQGKSLNEHAAERRQGPRRRQPGQHELPHRHEQRAGHPEGALHRDAAPRPQPRDRPAGREARGAGRPTSRRWACGATTRRRCTPTCSTRSVGGEIAAKVVDDQAWIEEQFLPTVGKRGAAIIEARGASSAARPPTRRSTTSTTGSTAPRRLGLDGRPLRRLLRRAGGPHLRLPCHLCGREWTIVAGPRDRRFSRSSDRCRRWPSSSTSATPSRASVSSRRCGACA